ncbi:TPA: site-specific DNA-methyltransferase [Campylobacter upsaliensis]|nr:site-specific DNA-methyltransferase [Campylobacter upsaliensis]
MKNELLQDLENRFETLKHIRNLAQSYDEKLFCYLLEQSTYKDEFKNRFFIMRNNTYIFKLNDFLTFLDLRNLSGSFTSYTNKIGLGFKTKSFLKTNNEVVLNFAYKDGVIKGGQSKDEDKKNEIFFNEILAKDEIDVLFARKALQNFELIGQGDLKENLNNANLLIKGNNLLALHSLKKKFANKVKLIYIDPPYNTGNDSFNYNDNFNHSTWLTFMKNRLEIARDFLRDDGVIFIQCDDNEQAYLKVLMDEIFGRENFISCFVWEQTQHFGRQKINFYSNKEFILCYAKKLFNGENKKRLLIESIQTEFEDAPLYNASNNKHILTFPAKSCIFKIDDGIYTQSEDDKYELLDSIDVKNATNTNEFRINFKSRWSDKTLQNEIKNGAKVLIKSKKLSPRIIYADNKEFIVSPKTIIFSNSNNPFCTTFKGIKVGTTENGSSEIENLLGKDIFKYPKPESLIAYLIEISTQEGDLVMDFFAGSGTTLAVAMKMKRQFIGIEQMDYIESITKERLKKVVAGEQGGISKAVDWQGGGSFIYAELMPLNAVYKKEIIESSSEKELENIYKVLESKAFLDYRIDLDSILKDKEFKELDLQEKKEVLLDILDSNMDYVLYGDIEDKDYAISSEVIELNKIFYGDDNV